MFIEADWGEKYQRLIDRGQLGQLAKEMVKDGYHPDEIEKIIKVIDGPIGGSYTIKGRPEREANWHMASGDCPDCGHSMKKHTRGGGCMNQKPGSSGKPVSCGCGRTAMKRNARGDGRDEREVARSRPYNDPVFSRGNPFSKARSESSLLQHEFDESDGGQSCGAPSEDEPGAICGWERSEHMPSKKHARWIELEARKFMADNEDAVSDLHELRTRAANFAALKTSTLPVDQHRAIVAGFVARVNELGRRIPKRTAARKVAAVNDFPDALMFID